MVGRHARLRAARGRQGVGERRERSHALTAADGVSLHALLATPPTPPRGALLLCHGLTTDRDEHGAFVALRDRALAAGLAVARFDFRAHGRSGGTNAQLRLAGVRADADAVAELIATELGPDLPLIPLGVSFGAAAAIHLAGSRSCCAGLVLWYAVVDYERNYGSRSPVPFTARMRAAADPARDPPWAAMPVVGTSCFLPSALIEELAGDPTPTTLARLTVPVLAYHGSRDEFVDIEPIRRLAATKRNIELRIARGAGHGFLLWRPWVVHQTVRWARRAAMAAARGPRGHRPL